MIPYNMNGLSSRLIGAYGYEFDERTYVIIERFLKLYLSRFEYKGIPDEVLNLYGGRKLWDLYLFFAPAVCWFKDPVYGVVCLPVSGSWKYNIVGKPVEWSVFAVNGKFHKELNDKNSVLMFNDNVLSIPYLQLLYESRFMRKLDMAMNQNIDLQSQPYIIEAYDDTVKTTSVWNKMLDKFKSRIVVRKPKDNTQKNSLIQSQVLNLSVDLKTKDMMTAYNEFLNRALTYLGFKNVNIEKSERLLTGEVSANDVVLQANYTDCLKSRNYSLDRVNKMFGVNYSVEPVDLESMIADINSIYQMAATGGVINESGKSSTK